MTDSNTTNHKSDENASEIKRSRSRDDDFSASLEIQSLSERLARTREQLAAFREIALSIGRFAYKPEGILCIICDKTTQLMRAEKTTIFLAENGLQNPPVLHPVTNEKSEPVSIPFGKGIVGTVAQQQQTVNIKDVSKCRRFAPDLENNGRTKMTSCLCMPIVSCDHKLLGVIQVANRLHGYFTLDDEEMLASICSQISVTLMQYHCQMSLLNQDGELRYTHDELQKKTEELDRLYALDREAATAPNLKILVEHFLQSTLRAFRKNFAAIYMIVGEQHRLYKATLSPDSDTILYTPVLLSAVPGFLSKAVSMSDVAMLSVRETETLPEQTEAVFGRILNSMLIAPLKTDENAFGALILGAQTSIPSFHPSDAKLASLFASHIAPALDAQYNREAAEKKQRLQAIGQMIASLLHDMKSPLANISGYVELMTMQPDENRRAQFASVIDRQIETLKNMSAEILQFARGESAILLIDTPMHDMIAAAVDLIKSEAARHRIDITLDEHFTGKLSCDAVKMQRLIVNLVRNAIEAIGQNGHICIGTAEFPETIALSITDDGPGIPPAIANTIFEPFVTHGKRGGTGLGLAIVKKIVDDHHAQIDCRPVQPHGTSFIISFKK